MITARAARRWPFRRAVAPRTRSASRGRRAGPPAGPRTPPGAAGHGPAIATRVTEGGRGRQSVSARRPGSVPDGDAGHVRRPWQPSSAGGRGPPRDRPRTCQGFRSAERSARVPRYWGDDGQTEWGRRPDQGPVGPAARGRGRAGRVPGCGAPRPTTAARSPRSLTRPGWDAAATARSALRSSSAGNSRAPAGGGHGSAVPRRESR